MGAVQIEQDDKIAVPDLGESALAFFFFGESGFLFALNALVGLVADFEDLYFDKGLQALGVLLLEHVEGFVLHFANAEYADHRFSFLIIVVIVNIF